MMKLLRSTTTFRRQLKTFLVEFAYGPRETDWRLFCDAPSIPQWRRTTNNSVTAAGGGGGGRVQGVPALLLGVLGVVGAVEEAALEQLDGDDGEDEVEQHVDDHDVDDVLQRVYHAVEHRLRPQHRHNVQL